MTIPKSLSQCRSPRQASLQLAPPAGGRGRPPRTRTRRRAAGRAGSGVRARPHGGRTTGARLGVVATASGGRDLHVEHRHGRERSERAASSRGCSRRLTPPSRSRSMVPSSCSARTRQTVRPCSSAIAYARANAASAASRSRGRSNRPMISSASHATSGSSSRSATSTRAPSASATRTGRRMIAHCALGDGPRASMRPREVVGGVGRLCTRCGRAAARALAANRSPPPRHGPGAGGPRPAVARAPRSRAGQERLAHLDGPVALAGQRQHRGQALLDVDEVGSAASDRRASARASSRRSPSAPPSRARRPASSSSAAARAAVAGAFGDLGGQLAPVAGQAGMAASMASSARADSRARSGGSSSASTASRASAWRKRKRRRR